MILTRAKAKPQSLVAQRLPRRNLISSQLPEILFAVERIKLNSETACLHAKVMHRIYFSTQHLENRFAVERLSYNNENALRF